MTQSIESMIEVLQAYKEGKKIEYSYEFGKTWRETDQPSWNFGTIEYRIAPEPKKKVKLEAWLTNDYLVWRKSESEVVPEWIRVPSEDKEILI